MRVFRALEIVEGFSLSLAENQMPEQSEIKDWYYATQKGRIAAFVASSQAFSALKVLAQFVFMC